MYITKLDLLNGFCRNGHAIVEGSHYTMQATGAIRCRLCRNEAHRKWTKNNPEEAHKHKITSQMRIRYGIQSVEERDALLVSQGNACAICGRTGLVWGKGYNDVWHIDHAHDQPGTHRAILCATCNTALGRLEPFLIRVVQYMMKWSPAFAEQIKQL